MKNSKIDLKKPVVDEIAELLKDAKSEDKNFNIKNLVIWVVGFVCYRYLMRVETPVGNTLICMVITIVLCFAVSKLQAGKGKNEK